MLPVPVRYLPPPFTPWPLPGETCFRMYSNTRTGLSPEFVNFVHGRDLVTPRTAPYNIGRPEAVETWFYMWYYTRDPKWREMGWQASWSSS